jgi:hypothetical protein
LTIDINRFDDVQNGMVFSIFEIYAFGEDDTNGNKKLGKKVSLKMK